MKRVSVILFGRGGTLGNFEVFARDLATRLQSERKEVVLRRTERRSDFFDFLANPPFLHVATIAELHIFSHSIGAGLFLGYGDPGLHAIRERALAEAARRRLRLYHPEVVAAEQGAILTDTLMTEPYASLAYTLRDRFDPKAFLKLWGCNSGVRNWVYSDNGVTDPSDTRVTYYWRALNERNTPKPSVAQALAWYFKRTVYGASSGAHIEILHHGHWTNSAQYKAGVGQWPSGTMVHRLHPDRGEYHAYHP